VSRHFRERGHPLAEPAAYERGGHQFIGLSIGQHADRDHGDPFPELAFAEQGQAVLDGMDIRAKSS
jgi:hypothetical protein